MRSLCTTESASVIEPNPAIASNGTAETGAPALLTMGDEEGSIEAISVSKPLALRQPGGGVSPNSNFYVAAQTSRGAPILVNARLATTAIF